jgi:hypothetical protein
MKRIILSIALAMLLLGGIRGISISADDILCTCGCGLSQEKCYLEGCPGPRISV